MSVRSATDWPEGTDGTGGGPPDGANEGVKGIGAAGWMPDAPACADGIGGADMGECGSGGGPCATEGERLVRGGGGASGIAGGAALARGIDDVIGGDGATMPIIVGTAARAGGGFAGSGDVGAPVDASALAAAAAAFSAISSRVKAVVGVGIDANGRTAGPLAGPLPVPPPLAGGEGGDGAGGTFRWLTT